MKTMIFCTVVMIFSLCCMFYKPNETTAFGLLFTFYGFSKSVERYHNQRMLR